MAEFNGGETVKVPMPGDPKMVLWALPGPAGDIPYAEIEQVVSDEVADKLGAVEDRISDEHGHIHQDVQHVDQVRAEIEQAYDASQAGQALPPRLTEAALNATYGTKAEVEQKADADALLPLVSAEGIMPTIQQTRVGTAAVRNVGLGDRLPRHIKLIQANAANETQGSIAGQTVTAEADSPWGQGIPAWRIVKDASGSARCDITFTTPPANPFPGVSAIGAEVWIEDRSKVSEAQIIVRGGPGTWTRQAVGHSGSSHSSGVGLPLVQGANIIRWMATASTQANLTGITGCDVRFTVSAGTTVWVRRTWAETPIKPRIAFIVDWGAKLGYEAWKADLRPLGIPITAAMRVGLMGQGTPPNHHMSVTDAKEMLAYGGNSLSIHSYAGNATSEMTAEQVRADYTKCLVELQRNGIYTDGVLHRAAWTRNLAANAVGIQDMLVTSRTHRDSLGVTPWPPIRPLDITSRRISDDPAIIDQMFNDLSQTNGLWMAYIHGVTPTGDANHISQASWDYFVGQVASRVAAGTLEGVTVEDLARRERLFHLPHLGLT